MTRPSQSFPATGRIGPTQTWPGVHSPRSFSGHDIVGRHRRFSFPGDAVNRGVPFRRGFSGTGGVVSGEFVLHPSGDAHEPPARGQRHNLVSMFGGRF